MFRKSTLFCLKRTWGDSWVRKDKQRGWAEGGHTILQTPGLAADLHCPRPGSWKFKVMVSAGLSPCDPTRSSPCVSSAPLCAEPQSRGMRTQPLTAFNLHELFTDADFNAPTFEETIRPLTREKEVSPWRRHGQQSQI